jgi:hypothetical protein
MPKARKREPINIELYENAWRLPKKTKRQKKKRPQQKRSAAYTIQVANYQKQSGMS